MKGVRLLVKMLAKVLNEMVVDEMVTIQLVIMAMKSYWRRMVNGLLERVLQEMVMAKKILEEVL